MADDPQDTPPTPGCEDTFPWEVFDEREPPPDDTALPRKRRDAFTEARKCAFLEALVKTGCLLDASRLVGVSARTVYRHQESDLRFAEHCATALRMRAAPVELTAWQRAVEGVEQEFACGGQVHVRRRYSDGLLRLLLQGSNPKKYGARPGFKRKRILRHEKKQMEREIRAEIEARRAATRPTIEQVTQKIVTRVGMIKRHEERQQLAAGWTRTADGHMIPPG